MHTKLFEVRDKATFIPVMATRVAPLEGTSTLPEVYLLRRAGFGDPMVILCRLECSGVDNNATYDPYSWHGARTMGAAHVHIQKHWEELESGAVIDVEYILGETSKPKNSEALDTIVAGENFQEP